MNIQLIEKLIKTNNETCPEIIYSNPLLDSSVARGLSKSFVKILKISKEHENQNLRLAVLQNIRKICKIEPDEHIRVDENLTELLIKFYAEQIQDANNPRNLDAVNKKLNAFLLRRYKDISINPFYKSAINPEVAQALINLNEKAALKETILQDVIHWNQDDKKCLTILKELWNSDETNKDNIPGNITDPLCDISIKLKSEIEKLVLEISYSFLQNENIDTNEILINNMFYTSLIKSSSLSSECFQICINILNNIFIMSNFHSGIHEFIIKFVQDNKSSCTKVTFGVLYPSHVRHIVTLLDFDLQILPLSLRVNYVKVTVNYLKVLHRQCETDLVLLLSHFPNWFDIYFEE